MTLIVFGEYSTAVEVAEAAREGGVDDVRLVACPPEAGERDALCRALADEGVGGYVIGFRDHALRAACRASCDAAGLTASTVVHPRAWISPTATLGDGAYVAANATVSANARLGARSLVLFNATIGHDAVLGDDVLVLPGARVSGRVSIGARCVVGSNAFVHQGVTVGDDARIDALTYVRADLEPRRLATSRQVRIYEARD